MTIKLQAITLQGFRAYLAQQAFDLRPGKSLAVFAPNAKGKSSLVDAIEVFFSETGSIVRLGAKKSDTKAGPEALEHVLAEKKKIAPSIQLVFRDPPAAEYGEERQVKRPPAARPKIATDIWNGCKHDFVVRGHELRAFVETQTPEERYAEVSKWFGLTPLVTSQKNLRTLRKKVTEMAGDDKVLVARATDISKATGGAVTSLAEADLIQWINGVLLAALDKTITLGSLKSDDPGYLSIKEQKSIEDDALGLTGLDQLLAALRAVAEEKDGTVVGRARDFATKVAALKSARDSEAKEKVAAEKSVFVRVWEEAQSVLTKGTLELEQCPVCDTPFDETTHGSRSAVSAAVGENLTLLAAYNESVATLRKAQTAAQQTHVQLKAATKSLEGLLKAGKYDAELAGLQSYFIAVEDWKPADAQPDDAPALPLLKGLIEKVSASAKAIRERQGEATFAGAVVRINELRRIANSIRQAKLEREELRKISEALESTAQRIDKDIADHVASLLHGLRDEINCVYAKIQGSSGAAVKVGLEPPDPEAKGKLKLGLVIDFADNRKGVNPAGYLSDSQVHTIALSLRLAAIKLFNPSFPFVVLDDIVTSYDADHRKALAAVMAEKFAGFQFILVTHDERFFRYLKDHMPAGEWQFRQITEIEKDFGPRYMDHRIADEVIDTKLSKGEHAANEIRQVEEEWLLGKAREFGVSLRIRDIDKPYAYDRGEVATGIASFLKGLKIETPVLPGFNNPLWISLQAGEVENFGSHFQDNPNASGSVGDEQKRWAEFKQFRDLFKCKCGSVRFKRPKVGVTKPLCHKCETPLAFQDRNEAAAADKTA
jgi:energy-coupling factor transporter ATP-binding protein EcfA2